MAIKFDELPPQVQNQLRQLQILQQQLEALMQQKLQIDIMIKDTENALDELSKIEENFAVYKNVGNLIIRADKDKLIKELQDSKETLAIRKKNIESQENKLKEKMEELQNKLQEILKT